MSIYKPPLASPHHAENTSDRKRKDSSTSLRQLASLGVLLLLTCSAAQAQTTPEVIYSVEGFVDTAPGSLCYSCSTTFGWFDRNGSATILDQTFSFSRNDNSVLLSAVGAFKVDGPFYTTLPVIQFGESATLTIWAKGAPGTPIQLYYRRSSFAAVSEVVGADPKLILTYMSYAGFAPFARNLAKGFDPSYKQSKGRGVFLYDDSDLLPGTWAWVPKGGAGSNSFGDSGTFTAAIPPSGVNEIQYNGRTYQKIAILYLSAFYLYDGYAYDTVKIRAANKADLTVGTDPSIITPTPTPTPCTSPTITTQPSSQTVALGQAATLSVTATGTAPLTYQWYEGEVGDTLRPVGTNSPSFTTPPLSASTKYWVRVSNSCDRVNSSAANLSICGVTVDTIPNFTIAPSWTQFNPATIFHPSTKIFNLLVRDICTQQPVPDATIQFEYEAVQRSGGHSHDDPARPKGLFERVTDPTQPNGTISYQYTAPEASGQIDVNLVVTTQDGRTYMPPGFHISVKVDGLVAVPMNDRYDLIGGGADFIHQDNHYVIPDFKNVLIALAKDYSDKHPGKKLQYNDMSLIYGGVFDLNGNWRDPHKGHNFGINADLDSLPVDKEKRSELVQLAWDNNMGVLSEGSHWHLIYGQRGYCKILNGRLCDPEHPPQINEEPPSARGAKDSAAISDVFLQAMPHVTFDQNTRLYTYQYSFRNDPGSLLEVSTIQIPLGSVAVSNLQAPQGWTANVWKDQTTVAFAATDIGTLPPNYVDDGNLLPSPHQIKQGKTLDGFSFQSPYPPGTVNLVAQGFKPLPTYVSDDETQQPSLFDGSYVGTTVGPILGGPILISEETSTRAIALDSPSWTSAPFQLNSPVPWGADRRTRIILFAMNFDLLPGESSSVVTADAEDASHSIYPLTVEYVGKVLGYDWLNCVVVRLNDNMGDIGDVLVRLTVRGVASNRVRLGIGHTGGGPPDDLGAVPTPGRQP